MSEGRLEAATSHAHVSLSDQGSVQMADRQRASLEGQVMILAEDSDALLQVTQPSFPSPWSDLSENNTCSQSAELNFMPRFFTPIVGLELG